MAVEEGDQDLVKQLLDEGADPNEATNDGRTPLGAAAEQGKMKIVNYLLDSGALVDKGDADGKTPLSWAAGHGHLEVVLVLFEMGADINKIDDIGRTALYLAARFGQEGVVGHLVAQGAQGGPAVSLATYTKNHKTLQYLLTLFSGDELHKTLQYCDKDHLRSNPVFSRTSLELAVQNSDMNCITEILQREKECHEDKLDGLYCLKSQLTYDENLKQTLAQFADQYDKTRTELLVAGLLCIIPVVISFAMYSFDIYSDCALTSGYYICSKNSSEVIHNMTECYYSNHSTNDYTVAFSVNVTLIALSYLPSMLIVITEARNLIKDKKGIQMIPYIIGTILACIFAPVTVFLAYSYSMVKRGANTRKVKEVKRLEHWEHYWGVMTQFEAGIESSCQLVLQTWLISPIILSHGNLVLPGIEGIIRGMLVLDTATALEKSVGKMLLALISVTFSIGGCYRFRKRGAISMVEMTPIYLSLLAEVTARILALGTFFSEVPQFEMWFPVMFAIHFSLVLIIKMMWEKKYWDKQEIHLGSLKIILAVIVSAASSFLVYVKMQPSGDKLKGRPDGAGASTADEVVLMAKREQSRNSMLNGHFYFHLLMLAENITLAAVPMMLGKHGKTYLYMMGAIVVLWVVSIVCKYVFYKLWGHPWKDINGPRSYFWAVCGCLCFLGKSRSDNVGALEMDDFVGKKREEIDEVCTVF